MKNFLGLPHRNQLTKIQLYSNLFCDFATYHLTRRQEKFPGFAVSDSILNKIHTGKYFQLFCKFCFLPFIQDKLPGVAVSD